MPTENEDSALTNVALMTALFLAMGMELRCRASQAPAKTWPKDYGDSFVEDYEKGFDEFFTSSPRSVKSAKGLTRG